VAIGESNAADRHIRLDAAPRRPHCSRHVNKRAGCPAKRVAMRAALLLRESAVGATAGTPVAMPAAAAATPAPRPAVRRRGLLERIDDWFWNQRQREIAAYLATSQNACELEQRMRDLERGTPHPYY
jgi:hypothetical protein